MKATFVRFTDRGRRRAERREVSDDLPPTWHVPLGFVPLSIQLQEVPGAHVDPFPCVTYRRVELRDPIAPWRTYFEYWHPDVYATFAGKRR
jgi:hypothetical protein